MNGSLLQWISALFCGAAGFCIFMMLLNRAFILMPDSRFKILVILLSLAAFAGGGAVAGLLCPVKPGLTISASILILVAIGEGWRLVIRRSCAGTPPVETAMHSVALMSPVTTTDLKVHHYKLPHPKWLGPPVRIVHLTDLHVHPALPLEYYVKVLALAEEAKPDITFITGDFVSRINALARLRQVLRPVGTQGTYASLGNHDYWTDPAAIRKIVAESGISLVSARPEIVKVGNGVISLSGCEHPWGPASAIDGNGPGDVLQIVLSHTPDNIYTLAKAKADVVFSGHCHAGQIRIPVLGPIVVPSVYGRRFDHGHFVVDGTHLFVASGVGAGDPPLRLYCQPDIFIVDLEAG